MGRTTTKENDHQTTYNQHKNTPTNDNFHHLSVKQFALKFHQHHHPQYQYRIIMKLVKYVMTTLGVILLLVYLTGNMILVSTSYYSLNDPRDATTGSLMCPTIVHPPQSSQPVSSSLSLTQQQQVSKSSSLSLRYDSHDATVLAMAQGYDLITHQRFVGTLRKSGFRGTIILATEPNMKPMVEPYLRMMNVTILKLKFIPCDKPIIQDPTEIQTAEDREANTCIDPYPDVKIRWGRYPFLRDALQACTHCTGPVLFSDARDTYFQRDPFGDGVPDVIGFQFFAEHPRLIDAGHGFTQTRVRKCKHNFEMKGKPMLCSGTTVGTRETMLLFLDAMYQEMKVWMSDPDCYFRSHGGDQAIMNYLYYSGHFNFSIMNNSQIFYPRTGGIVNTVGVIGRAVALAHFREGNEKAGGGHKSTYYSGATEKNWLGRHLDMTDTDGYLIEYDGSRSRAIHQYDRYGENLANWLDRGILYDKIHRLPAS